MKNMYTRTHVFKFVNKVSRDSFKFLTVWKSKREWEKSFQKAGEYSDLKKQNIKLQKK